MGALDFLFQGNTPPAATSSIQGSTTMPDWWQEYTRGLLSRANAVAGQDYTATPVPGVAGLTQDQQNAFSSIRSNQGAWQPALQGALTTTQGIMNQNIDPLMDSIASQGARNLSEKLLPQIEQTFIGSGQFGGDRQNEFTARAVRDSNESILNAQAGAMLQNQQQRLAAAQQAGSLASARQQLGLTDAAALENIGATQQQNSQQNLDWAQKQFETERDWDKNQAIFMNQIIRGLDSPTSTTQTTTAPYSGTLGASGLQSLLGAGLTAGALGWKPFRRGGRVGALAAFRSGGRAPMYRRGGALSMVC